MDQGMSSINVSFTGRAVEALRVTGKFETLLLCSATSVVTDWQ